MGLLSKLKGSNDDPGLGSGQPQSDSLPPSYDPTTAPSHFDSSTDKKQPDPSLDPSLSTQQYGNSGIGVPSSGSGATGSYGGVGGGAAPLRLGIIILASSSRLRMINLPQELIGAIADGVTRTWPKGIKNQEGVESGGWEINTHGSPWDPSFANTAHSRRLISSVLQAVYSHGYELVASTSLTRKWNDKDTLFIRRSSTGPRIRVFFSVSFHSDDKIRIVDPPDEGVRMAFESAVHANYPKGIQNREEVYPNAWELKLKGSPWYSSSQANVDQGRIMCAAVIQGIEERGYEFVGSIDMSVGVANDTTTMDSWFFASR